MRKIERALISVHDKTGVVDLAAGLAALDVEIISTGGTARLLASNGIRVREVSDLTGFPGNPRWPRQDDQSANCRGNTGDP